VRDLGQVKILHPVNNCTGLDSEIKMPDAQISTSESTKQTYEVTTIVS